MKTSIDLNRVLTLLGLIAILVLAVTNRYRVHMPWLTFEPAETLVGGSRPNP